MSELKLTQSEAILEHLERFPWITPITALQDYGCLRLAARINDLRRDGHRINTEMVTRNGKTFARYSLEKPE